MSDELVQLAAAQDGLLTRHQLLTHGVTVDAIRHALGRNGRWRRIVNGIYAAFTGPLQERHLVRAALLYAGPGAMVTGSTACRAYGLRYAPAAGRTQLLVPESVQRARIAIANIRRTRALPVPRDVQSFPCAPPERAAVDACRDQRSLRTVRAVLCEVVQRGLTTPQHLVATLAQGQSNGSALPRRALEDIVAGCRSAPECEFGDMVLRSTILPEPAWNTPLPDPRGADIYPDARLAQARLLLEMESVGWHPLRGCSRTHRTPPGSACRTWLDRAADLPTSTA
jgi:hypothetical protein